MKGMTVQYLLITGLVISLFLIGANLFVGGTATVYGMNATDNVSYLNIAQNVSNVTNSLQSRLSGGNVLENAWNSLDLLGKTADIYGALIREASATLKLPFANDLNMIAITIVTLIVVFAIIRAITKQNV